MKNCRRARDDDARRQTKGRWWHHLEVRGIACICGADAAGLTTLRARCGGSRDAKSTYDSDDADGDDFDPLNDVIRSYRDILSTRLAVSDSPAARPSGWWLGLIPVRLRMACTRLNGGSR